MHRRATACLVASLLAALATGAASASGEEGYPPPPGPYRSGPWVAVAIPSQPASDAAQPRTPTDASGMPQAAAPTPLQPDAEADYSATNLFGSPAAAGDPAQVPAWPEALISAPREPLYEPAARQPDFSISGQRELPPGDFAVDFSKQRALPPAKPLPPAQTPPVGWRQGADFSGLPATLPGAMPYPDANRQAVAPTPAYPVDRPAQPSPAAAPPLPNPPALRPRQTEHVEPAPTARAQSPGSLVFRPPELTGD